MLTPEERLEHKRKCNKKYRLANLGKCTERQLAWQRANPKKCREKNNKYYLSHPEKFRELRKKYRYAQYGLTVAVYNSMNISQGGVCAICGGPEQAGRPLSVDHDHSTGTVRGLLCSRCNVGLGEFLDSEDLLSRAISYLRERRK
jgi:hypothetical protein